MDNKVEYSLSFQSPSMRIMGYRPVRQEPWRLEIALKRIRGICFYACEASNELPSLETLRSTALKLGIRSPRPFILGSARDCSVRRCAFALVHELFLTRVKDPERIFTDAYRSGAVAFTYPDMEIIIRQAEWEGLILPERWDEEQIQELIETLRACGENEVAELIRRHI